MSYRPLEATISQVNDSEFKINTHLFLGKLSVQFTFTQEELSSFIQSYFTSNTLPIDTRDSRELKQFSFYDRRKHSNSKCDYCSSSGEYKLHGELFGGFSIEVVLCPDCFQNLLNDFSKFIKSQSEEVVSHLI